MPLDKLVTALVLGLSWERILCCPFLAMSLSLSERGAGFKFLLGRLAGVVLLGVIITLAGKPFPISPRIFDSVFGFFLIGLAVSTLLKSSYPHKQSKISQASLGLGLFRGLLNPGRKIIYLFPLLWGAGIGEGLIVSLIYALSSSIYLLVGFFSAQAVNKIFSHKKTIRISGAVILVLLGIFYIFKALQMGA